ncbi:coiled-coil domain-containing protein 39 [Phymastichus coffea]|uniref:coiled-coil domain-containing protein 39 n=1 Tax=Phymastichus coffea TaxID=108790 RepID=UPI00273C90BC|nr:coiled-coil domain-containing protein 39 [Phymastichus coffea]
MVNAIEEVLNDLGWNDGFRIPIANAENKQLEEEIERKSRLRASLKSQLENTLERIQDIRKHASDVKQEQKHNQKLLSAHSTQVETENHLYRLSQSEESKLAQEMKQREKQTRELNDKIIMMKQNVVKLTKKLENTKRNIQLDKDRLLSWEEKLNKKEEKNMIIEQLVKSDEKDFKKIELERQQLSEKAEIYRQTVIKSVGDIQELELTLERTTHLYSQAVKDRRQLMDQWTQSVNVLTQRDKAIYDALQEINFLREVAKERMDVYQDAERFLSIQENENKELEDSIKQLERDLSYVREERQKLSSIIDSYTIELYVRQKHLQELARRIQDTRANLKRKRSEVGDKRAKVQECTKRIEDLKETLKNIDGQKMNIEERTFQLQDMLEKEEKRKLAILKEIKRQQALILRTTTQFSELEGEHKVLLLRHQGEAKEWDQLLAEQAKEEKSIKDKRESAYHIDVELQKCEMRLANILGQERDKDELEAKHQRSKHLQKILQEKTETIKTLQGQLAQVENEARKISNSIATNNEELQRLKGKQQELLVMIEGGEKQLKAAQSNYEERKVEESILELRLKEAGKIVSKVDDKLYDLEKYAIQIEAAMQERKSDIKVQKESLNLQRKVVLNDCAELRMMIAERRSRIQQLQARYDIHVAMLGINPEDGSPITSTYLAIQSAQERYLLKERGDKLNQTIRKAEMEIRSMENTLRLVNVCNDKYKSSLSLVDDDSAEKAEQRKLDEELLNVLELNRQKQYVLDQLEQDYKRMEDNCEQLDKDIKKIKDERELKRQTVSNLEQQITEQKEKILRADKNLRKILKDIQNKCVCESSETLLLQERDIAVRELQEQNTLALQRITEFTIRHLEAEAYVKKLLTEHSISLPCTYYLRQQATPITSSRCESAISSSRTSLLQPVSSSRESAIQGSVAHFKPDFSGDFF